MEEALYGPDTPFETLRLASASALSSWALLNVGDAESNYGYWFPGAQHNGAAGGGFESAPTGVTWLDQPHHRGSWYYSCEIDLGFCGALRAANTVLVEDPDFGRVCHGGTFVEMENTISVIPQDGVQRRFHYITEKERIHILVDGARLEKVELHGSDILCYFEDTSEKASLRAFTHSGKGIVRSGYKQQTKGWYRIDNEYMELSVR